MRLKYNGQGETILSDVDFVTFQAESKSEAEFLRRIVLGVGTPERRVELFTHLEQFAGENLVRPTPCNP